MWEIAANLKNWNKYHSALPPPPQGVVILLDSEMNIDLRPYLQMLTIFNIV